MEGEFASALLASPQPVIIGVRMRPYSLGHRILLTQIKSAYASRERFPLFEDLIASCFVCAHTWEDNRRLLHSTWRRWLTLKVWGKFAGKFDIPSAMIAFMSYVNESDAPPDEAPQNEGRELHAPKSARLYLFLRDHGFTEHESMNMPLNAAHWLYASAMEGDGRIELISGDFHEAIRRSQGGLN